MNLVIGRKECENPQELNVEPDQGHHQAKSGRPGGFLGRPVINRFDDVVKVRDQGERR